MNKSVAAVTSVAIVTAAQLIGGRRRPSPDQPLTAAWYSALRKPDFTPPPPAFAVAWTALSGLLAFSGYRLMTAPPSQARRVALAAWSSNLAGIAGFSWVLFGRKRLDEAFGVTVYMAVSASLAVAAAAQVDRLASLAGLPLVGWTTFATLLQEEVWRRNSG